MADQRDQKNFTEGNEDNKEKRALSSCLVRFIVLCSAFWLASRTREGIMVMLCERDDFFWC